MKKYSDYKNSSVPWIGEIPTTWNLSQLRYVIECLDGKRVPVELIFRHCSARQTLSVMVKI